MIRNSNGSGIFRLFNLFGTPVSVHWTYLLVFVAFPLFTATADGGNAMKIQLSFVIAVFLSLLVHEFGHVWANLRNGFPSFVVLWGLGGMTYSEGIGRTRGWRSIGVSLAGPFAGFLLWAIFWFLLMPKDAVESGMRWSGSAMFDRFEMLIGMSRSPDFTFKTWHFFWVNMCFLNLVWGLLNLLPIYPLDGGSALEELLRLKMRAIEARRISSIVSIVVVGLAFVALATMPSLDVGAMPVIVLGLLGFQNYQRLRGAD